MGYQNDQYFNFHREESGESPVGGVRTTGNYNTLADNPLFRYPDRTVRTNDGAGRDATYLKRGYIRSLPIISGTELSYPARKCQFQFNPATITQSVQQNDSYLNFLQQDPAQYAQPMPGNVNFNFQLMFDRSMELNNLSNPDQGLNQGGTGGINPWEVSGAGQVGVLRDLSAFYDVIGQGLSSTQQQYVNDALSEFVTLEHNVLADAGEESEVDKAKDNIPEFLSVNLGNSAFLLPLPVRVVFSALYIVEGFVSNSTVTFTKFNTSMVPMQCILNVTMDAKYIGFAKKDTFLTWSLEQTVEEAARKVKEEEERVEALVKVFADSVTFIEMKLSQLGGTVWPDVGFDSNLETLLAAPGNAYQVWTRLPQISQEGTDAVSKTLFDGGATVMYKHFVSVNVYGPVPGAVSRLTSNQTELARLAATSTNLLSAHPRRGNPVSVAATKEDWLKVAKSTNNEEWLDVTVDVDDLGINLSAGYYIVHYEAVVIASVDGEILEGRGEYFRPIGPGAGSGYGAKGLINRLNIEWDLSNIESISLTGGIVLKDNEATAEPASGDVSDVGAPVVTTTPRPTTTGDLVVR